MDDSSKTEEEWTDSREMKFLCLFDPPHYLLLFIPCHLTSSFATVITTTATRGRHLTRNIIPGHNKLLSQSTFKIFFMMRTGCKRCMWVKQKDATGCIMGNEGFIVYGGGSS